MKTQSNPLTYRAWKKLSWEEQKRISWPWNTFRGEGSEIAHAAARAFKRKYRDKVKHVRVGLYHGGLYSLDARIKDYIRPKLPTMFQGFIVNGFHDRYRSRPRRPGGFVLKRTLGFLPAGAPDAKTFPPGGWRGSPYRFLKARLPDGTKVTVDFWREIGFVRFPGMRPPVTFGASLRRVQGAGRILATVWLAKMKEVDRGTRRRVVSNVKLAFSKAEYPLSGR